MCIRDSLKAVVGALKHPSAAVRKNALQVLPSTNATAQALLNNNTLNDSEPLVVLNTLLKFTETPLTSDVEKAVLARFESSNEADDRWLPDAFSVILNAQSGKLMQTYLAKRTVGPVSYTHLDVYKRQILAPYVGYHSPRLD